MPDSMDSNSASTDLTALAINAVAGPGGGLSVSELHGAVIGIAVANLQTFSLQALVDLLGADALSSEADLAPFVNESLAALLAQDLSFMLLLPDDDEALVDQLEGLASWTASFLAGLVAGLSLTDASMATLPEDAQEIVRDFSAIAQVEVETGDPDAEADFLQLREFVKVGVLLIMSVLNDVADDSGQ
jgi:uncharacterized protein